MSLSPEIEEKLEEMRLTAQLNLMKTVVYELGAGPFMAVMMCAADDGFGAPLWLCPHCAAPAYQRQHWPGGNDTCRNGHVYPSGAAIVEMR